MPLKIKIETLLQNQPRKVFTFKQIARRFAVNTGAVGTAVMHIPKKFRNRIISQNEVA